jgi:hypothetical protein
VLIFSSDRGRYNPYTDVVTFFAMDGDLLVMCNVSRDSLEYLEGASDLTDRALLAAFARHRAEIRRVAMERHASRPRLACALVKAHFTLRGGGNS